MTKPLPFTQAGLKRAIQAAQAAGLHVAGIRPDGTIIVYDQNNPLASEHSGSHDAEVLRRWGDDE